LTCFCLASALFFLLGRFEKLAQHCPLFIFDIDLLSVYALNRVTKTFKGTPKGGEKKEVTRQVVEMRLINLDASLDGSISGVSLTEGKGK